MNPNLARVVLRSRDPLEVLDLAFRFARERHAPLGRLTAAVLGPPWLLCVGLCWLFEGAWWVLIVPVVLAPALQAPFTVMAGRLLFADDVPVRPVLVDVARRLPALAATWGLGALGWIVASFTCFVGLPWVQAGLLYLPETVLLERVGPQRSAQRSLRLASGQMAVSLAGAVGKWVLILWLALLGELTGGAVVGFVLQLGQPFGSLLDGDVTPWLIGGLLVAQPVVAIYRLLLYVDVRTRTEGWDLQVALRALGLER